MSETTDGAGFEFRLFAPNNRAASLIGDFSDWNEIAMVKGDDGYFRVCRHRQKYLGRRIVRDHDTFGALGLGCKVDPGSRAADGPCIYPKVMPTEVGTGQVRA